MARKTVELESSDLNQLRRRSSSSMAIQNDNDTHKHAADREAQAAAAEGNKSTPTTPQRQTSVESQHDAHLALLLMNDNKADWRPAFCSSKENNKKDRKQKETAKFAPRPAW